MMADAVLAQSAIDRIKSPAYQLVVDGQSYRLHQKPTVSDPEQPLDRPEHHDADVEYPGHQWHRVAHEPTYVTLAGAPP